MAEIKLGSNRIIGDNREPYVVAELNSSHYGNVERAKKMIDSAYDCGCDAIKLQSWSTESLYSEEYYEGNPMAKRMVKGFSLNEEAILELTQYTRDKGMDFSSTPYSEKEVDYLVDVCHADYIKISSMELNNIGFLKYIARKKKPIMLSTGMGSLDEIKRAVGSIQSEGNNDICVLHCVSVYPIQAEGVNLNNILMLRKEFPNLPIGYSDHTIGYEVSCGAVALGVGVLEKHFTLNNKKVGWDNQMATEPEEMKALVNNCRNVYRAMGSYARILSEEEIEQRSKMRRSLVSSRDLIAGTVIQKDSVIAMRPGTGIEPTALNDVIGKVLKNDIKKGYQIKYSDLGDCETRFAGME